jgi:RNA polymerase sigma-70 factor (ECF subfamily)
MMADADAPEDAELLEAWRGGDTEAGGKLFERHFVSVFRFFAAKLGDIAAQDLTQRTFVAVVQSRDRVREGAKFRGFVLAVARNQLLMHLRSRGRRGVDVELANSCVDELMPSPDSALAGTEQERLVVRALRRLPLDQQILVELHYWEDLSTEEVGEILGIPRGTVKSRLFRARDELRTTLATLAAGERLGDSSIQDLEQWVARIRSARPPSV